jgi:hypothetical protein
MTAQSFFYKVSRALGDVNAAGKGRYGRRWRTCGAETNVGITSSPAVQLNQVGVTRGVPSLAV